jgi:hypothetical protein
MTGGELDEQLYNDYQDDFIRRLEQDVLRPLDQWREALDMVKVRACRPWGDERGRRAGCRVAWRNSQLAGWLGSLQGAGRGPGASMQWVQAAIVYWLGSSAAPTQASPPPCPQDRMPELDRLRRELSRRARKVGREEERVVAEYRTGINRPGYRRSSRVAAVFTKWVAGWLLAAGLGGAWLGGRGCRRRFGGVPLSGTRRPCCCAVATGACTPLAAPPPAPRR